MLHQALVALWSRVDETEPRRLAQIGNWLDLLTAMRARIVELGITYDTLDALIGWDGNCTSKYLVEEPPPPAKDGKRGTARGIGPNTFDLLLRGLAVKLVMVEDAEQLERLKRNRNFEQRRFRMPAIGKHRDYIAHRIPLSRLLANAPEGGRARAAKLSPVRRKYIAKHAAIMRWSAVKAAAAGKPDPLPLSRPAAGRAVGTQYNPRRRAEPTSELAGGKRR